MAALNSCENVVNKLCICGLQGLLRNDQFVLLLV